MSKYRITPDDNDFIEDDYHDLHGVSNEIVINIALGIALGIVGGIIIGLITRFIFSS